MPNWSLVHSASSRQEAEMVKGLLETHGIAAVVMDQGSSTYPQLHSTGVYVDRDHLLKALHVVRNTQQG